MRRGHAGFPRGTRVVVVLRDGSRFLDRFADRTDTVLVLRSGRRVAFGALRAVAKYKREIHGAMGAAS